MPVRVEVDGDELAASEIEKHQARMKPKSQTEEQRPPVEAAGRGRRSRPPVEACSDHCDAVDGETGYSASTHTGRETKPLLGAVLESKPRSSKGSEKRLRLRQGVMTENAKGL
jgi:hypothetical protein